MNNIDRRGLSNFLATDEVPETIFGIPIVSRPEQYTERDLAFFEEHPEAGGYYDLDGDAAESHGDEGGGDSRGFGATTHAERTAAALDKVIPFIKKHEKFRGDAYWDKVGKIWTIGYGQTMINGRRVRKGDKISERDAAAFVERRVRDNAAKLDVQNAWTRNLSAEALAAVYDVAYNMGYGIFSRKKSPNLNQTMDDADMDFDAIVWSELPTYIYSKGVKVDGLVDRRNDALNTWRGPADTQADTGGGEAGDPWVLDATEQAEYERLKATGQYKDDQVIKLRAMRATRGDDYVKDLAWKLREERDMALAEKLAEDFNKTNPYTAPSTAQDFYRRTNLDVVRTMFDKTSGPEGRTGREAFVNDLNERIAEARKSGDAERILDAHRSALFYARRFGLDYRAKHTGQELRRADLWADENGWIPTGRPYVEVRPMRGGPDQYRYLRAVDFNDPAVRENPELYAERILTTDLYNRTARANPPSGVPRFGEGPVPYHRHFKTYDGATEFSVALPKAEREHLDSMTAGYGRAKSHKAKVNKSRIRRVQRAVDILKRRTSGK